MDDFLLNINGAEHRVRASRNETLLSVLRNQFHLTGTKYGCGEGQCGACTVLIDGAARRSCLTRVASVAGRTDHDYRRAGKQWRAQSRTASVSG